MKEKLAEATGDLPPPLVLKLWLESVWSGKFLFCNWREPHPKFTCPRIIFICMSFFILVSRHHHLQASPSARYGSRGGFGFVLYGPIVSALLTRVLCGIADRPTDWVAKLKLMELREEKKLWLTFWGLRTKVQCSNRWLSFIYLFIYLFIIIYFLLINLFIFLFIYICLDWLIEWRTGWLTGCLD